MPTKTEPKRPPGRPVLPAEQRRDHRVAVRLTEAQREKLRRLGGGPWLVDQIDGSIDPAMPSERR